jgi:fumarylacetoacetase
MTSLKRSWVASANNADTNFPLNNLPYGVFTLDGADARCGVAIGDMILDVTVAEELDLLRADRDPVFDWGAWNGFMELGPEIWGEFRIKLTEALTEGSKMQTSLQPLLVAQSDTKMLMPFGVSEYTDFYAGRHHATNVGTMFRGAENALPPNWLHIPIGYNGRASSVVVSGTPVRRPWGQLKGPDDAAPRFAPCARFDLELEIGAIVGIPSDGPVTVDEAENMIFGYVLLNDWSARDIQAWEYQPLGPFQAKATATTISPWIVTSAALEPFRAATPEPEKRLLAYLAQSRPMLYDIDLGVALAPPEKPATIIAQTNYREMYYSAPQQLAHHTTSGCPMNVGDLLGSGTISGKSKPERGSLLELSWGGKEPLTLDSGETRAFLQDGDTLTISGAALGNGYKIGFGDASGQILPALKDPYAR